MGQVRSSFFTALFLKYFSLIGWNVVVKKEESKSVLIGHFHVVSFFIL
jgi:hypothetical protein